MRPFRVLDVAACEGGATRGYQMAGAHVTAVDTDPERLKRNPADERVLGDGVAFIRDYGHLFDLIHASWPCQKWAANGANPNAVEWPDLIDVGRDAAIETGRLYVIENVPQSPLRADLVLCGTMFGLTAVDEDGLTLHLRRHRKFESNFPLTAPRSCRHPRSVQWAGVYGGGRRAKRLSGETLAQVAPRDRYAARHERRGGYAPRSERVQSELLGGVPWMSERGRQECIPPAYAEWVGLQARAFLSSEVAA